jgi:hypothetical protein
MDANEFVFICVRSRCFAGEILDPMAMCYKRKQRLFRMSFFRRAMSQVPFHSAAYRIVDNPLGQLSEAITESREGEQRERRGHADRFGATAAA